MAEVLGVDTTGTVVVSKVVGAMAVGVKIHNIERGDVLVVYNVDTNELGLGAGKLDVDEMDVDEMDVDEMDVDEMDVDDMDVDERLVDIDVDVLSVIEESSRRPQALRPRMGQGPKLNANGCATKNSTKNTFIIATLKLLSCILVDRF
jgi:hypothetical protein